MGMRIRLLGRPEIRDESGAPQRIRGHKPWALLARILATERPLSRQQLASELFPDANDPLGSLRWSLAELRRAVGSADAFSGDPVAANLPAGVVVDIASLPAGSIDVFDDFGSLLEGIDPKSSPEFESWLLVERERTAAMVNAQLRQAVLRALSVGDGERAVRLAQLAVSRLPLDEGAHVLFVKALVATGRTEAAAEHVTTTEAMFDEEIGVAPSAALRSAARPAVAAPAPGVPARAVAAALLDAGLAALDAGAVDAGMECLRRAAAEAVRAGDRRLQGLTLVELGTALVHAVRGYDDEGAVVLRQAADLGHDAGDVRVTARALQELGYTDALVGRRPTAAASLAAAAEVADGDPELLAAIEATVGFNLSGWGRQDDAIEHYRRAIDLARVAAKPRREAWSMGLGARALLLAGDVDGAADWLDSCLDLVATEQWVAFRPWPAALLGEVHLARGRDAAVVRSGAEETFALSCQLGDPCWEGSSARVIALTHAITGELAAALEWIAEARGRATRHPDAYAAIVASILATDAELSARTGDAVRAEAAARELLALAARTHQDAFVAEALRLLELGS